MSDSLCAPMVGLGLLRGQLDMRGGGTLRPGGPAPRAHRPRRGAPAPPLGRATSALQTPQRRPAGRPGTPLTPR